MHVTDRFIESSIMIPTDTKKIERRKFFGYLGALAAAGSAFGSIGRLFRSGKKKEPVRTAAGIVIHPLAVPRTKKGAHSNG
jgi:hypothetical protein